MHIAELPPRPARPNLKWILKTLDQAQNGKSKEILFYAMIHISSITILNFTCWLNSQVVDGALLMTTRLVFGTSRPIDPAEVDSNARTGLQKCIY